MASQCKISTTKISDSTFIKLDDFIIYLLENIKESQDKMQITTFTYLITELSKLDN